MKSLHLLTSRSLLAGLAAVVLAGTHSARAAAIPADQELGASVTPAGANYTIFAVQDVTAANPLGTNGAPIAGLNVTFNFENTASFGARYQFQTGNGQQGINIYNNAPGGGIQSTGLLYSYNAPVTASSVNIPMTDFDLNGHLGQAATMWGGNGKAEAQIAILKPDGSLLAFASNSQVLPNLINTGSDMWNVNLGGLLHTLGLADQAVGGFVVSAAAFPGATFQYTTTDDAFFVGNVANGVPPGIPETSTIFPLLAVLGMIVLGPRIRRKLLPPAPETTA